MSKILRRNVFINTVLDNTGRFEHTITCPFDPDAMKVKSIGFYLTGGTAGMFSLHCDSLAHAALGSFFDPVLSLTGITYSIDRNPTGTHTFRVDWQGLPATGIATGTLNIHLEFRKYVKIT